MALIMKKSAHNLKKRPGSYLAPASLVIAAAVILVQSYQTSKGMTDSTVVSVRYLVDDVDSSVTFYTGFLNFHVVAHPGPGFAMLSRGNLRLLLNKPGGGGGAGQPMPDGAVPSPGGWNRIQIEVEDLEQFIKTLKAKGAGFRNELVVGRGGKQILLQDPSGNLIELFEPNR